MIDFDGEFEGEVRINPIKYSKILTKVVMPNNPTSGKIQLPSEYISQKVIVLLPKLLPKKR